MATEPSNGTQRSQLPVFPGSGDAVANPRFEPKTFHTERGRPKASALPSLHRLDDDGHVCFLRKGANRGSL